MLQQYQNSWHIIRPVIILLSFTQLLVKQLLKYTSSVLSLLQSTPNPLHHFFVALSLPYPVATYQNELQTLPLAPYDIRSRGDHLLVGCQRPVSFELQVTHRPRYIQSVINPAFYHISACLLDSSQLRLVLRFMVIAQRHSSSLRTRHASGITSIGHIYIPRGNKTHISRTPRKFFGELIVPIIIGDVMSNDTVELPFAGFGLHDVVHFIEGLDEGFFIFFCFEFGV